MLRPAPSAWTTGIFAIIAAKMPGACLRGYRNQPICSRHPAAKPHSGAPGSTDQDLHAVLEQAGLRDWLEGLPNGLDTWLGERGQQMSGGERQRLCVARALLQDAPVVLLDEPTAHLDAVTEQELIETLHRVLAEKTVLWASHSLTGMQWMDEIVVLEGGRVVERGTHAQLIEKGGLYASMYRIQHDELIADL